MGNELFGVDIAGIVADSLGDSLLDVTVTRQTQGLRTPGNLTGPALGEPLTFDGIKGFWEDFTGTPPPGVMVEVGDRKAVLIGDTIPSGGTPRRGDAITIEGVTQYVVALVSRDPAAAVYVFQCRDRRGSDGA